MVRGEFSMVVYKVTVSTGENVLHGTRDHIFITLYGTEGKSERKKLNEAPELSSGEVRMQRAQ